MGNNPDIIEQGKATQFPHNDPTKGGRPTRLAQLEKQLGIKFPKGTNIKEVEALISSMLMMNRKELGEIGKKDESPILAIITASALIQSVKKGKTDELMKLMERVFGKPKQSTDITSNGETLTITVKDV